MRFTAKSGEHQVGMDTQPPLGSNTALTPKQLLVAGICGCTAMDVVALLKKHKQPLEALDVEAETQLTEGKYPAVFKEVQLTFKVRGNVDSAQLIDAVALSQTRYCGVSAMVSKVVPIHYVIELNGREIGSGQAKFDI